MKKFFSICVMCLLAITMNAKQVCAVMDFDHGTGVSQENLDGISEMFMTYFRPNGYTMAERAQIDKVIKELNFQRSGLTDNQKVQVGRGLNASIIVVGKVSRLGGKYQVDVRVVDVKTAHDIVADGATFEGDYRTNMQKLAKSLEKKVLSHASSDANLQPILVYGYLKVFPRDLGNFDSQPKQIIKRINQVQQYGYGTWRLPTNEELELMRSADVIGNDGYMTKEHQQGLLRLVTDMEIGDEMPPVPEGYVDLGLPSGTLWKEKNEEKEKVDGQYKNAQYYYEYREILVSEFSKDLPSTDQIKELVNECQWVWIENGYKVIGPNGNTLVFPILGWTCRCCGNQNRKDGNYWSAKGDHLILNFEEISIEHYQHHESHSTRGYSWCEGNEHDGCCVRLVKNP